MFIKRNTRIVQQKYYLGVCEHVGNVMVLLRIART